MRRLVLPVVALALLAAAPAAAAKTHLTPRQEAASRAKGTYSALQKYFYVKRAKLYKGAPYSRAWPFSQALAATVALASVPGIGSHYTADVADRLDGLNAYWDESKQPHGYDGGVVPPLGRGGDIGYDDNEWIGLELLRRYRRDRDVNQLQRAQDTFALAVYGWDKDPTHPCPGGVLFSQAPDNVDRNTVTNAPATVLGLRLYQITHDPTYLDWSRHFYDWVRTCMLTPEGLFADHISFDGTIDHHIWAYNQGTMVGANVMWWKVTGEQSYLRRAVRAAQASLAYFTPTRLRREPPFFTAIYFDQLAMLNAVRPARAYTSAMQQFADWAWSKRRNKKSGVFSFGPDGGLVIQQAAMIRVYATLAGADLIG